MLLVEGNHRVSTAIKYLTQSTWSHAAMYVGDFQRTDPAAGDDRSAMEKVAKKFFAETVKQLESFAWGPGHRQQSS